MTKKNTFIVMLTILLLLLLLLLLRHFVLEENKIVQNHYTFGATYMSLDNPFFEELNTSIREIIEANGDELIVRNPTQDQEKQNEEIFAMIDQGIDLLFLSPIDGKKVQPALLACQAKGIPVVNIDTAVNDTSKVASIITSNNYKAGVLIAKDILHKNNKARIVLLSHDDVLSTFQRANGFIDTLKDQDNFTIIYTKSVATTLEANMQAMLDFLDKDIPFDIVFAANDPSALGVLAALQKRNISHGFAIYGVDGSPMGKEMIKQGHIEGTSAQFPHEMGIRSASVAYDILEGKRISKYIFMPIKLITSENIDQYSLSGWQ